MGTSKEYWVLCEDQGYEGLSGPLGIFDTEEAAKDWAYEQDCLKQRNWSVPTPQTKEHFLSFFYISFYLEKVNYYE